MGEYRPYTLNYSTGQCLELEREKLPFGLYIIMFRLLRIELSKSKLCMVIQIFLTK